MTTPQTLTEYWARYPLRKAYYVHRCKVCGKAITKSERYVDGGEPWRRAHTLCVSGRSRYATTDEVRNSGERMLQKHRTSLETLGDS